VERVSSAIADRTVFSFLRCASRMRCRSPRSSSLIARSGDARDGGLEDAAHVHQLVLQMWR